MPKITGLHPMLETLEFARTVEFYTDVLGFNVEATFGHDPANPVWASLHRDGAWLMVTTMQSHTHEPGEEHDHVHYDAPVLTGALYFNVDDVDGLALDLGGKVELEWGPENMNYGMREIALKDPNGYLLIFGQNIES